MSMTIRQDQDVSLTHYHQHQATLIYHAMCMKQLSFWWYLSDAWCTILIKAVQADRLTWSEQAALNVMVTCIKQPKPRQSFFHDWIVPFFIETEEGDCEDDYT